MILSLLLAILPLQAAGSRHAVVVGVETYERLGPELRVQGARQDATHIARVLDEQAHFDEVRLLTDASATRTNLESLFRQDLAPRLGPDDTLLFYFVGIGIGGDFGNPGLLPYDTDPAALEQSLWSATDLGTLFKDTVKAGHVIVITDASHAGSLGALALLGPGAEDWPDPGRPSLFVAASAPREVSRPGVFSEAFAQALSGAADDSADGRITSGELVRYLVTQVPGATGDKQHPTVNVRHDPGMELVGTQGPAPTGLDKVKYVFQGLASPTVQCTGTSSVSCDPSCYVWNPEPGPCAVTALLGGRRLEARVEINARGRIVCAAQGDRMGCTQDP